MANPLNSLLATMLSDIDEICDEMDAGRMNDDDFQGLMTETLLEHHLAAYLAASGARQADEEAVVRVGEVVKEQLKYLNKFADTVGRNGWETAYRARARMYAGSIKVSYSLGDTKLLPLPGYPAQGTECRTNCKCGWQVKVVDSSREHYDCYWRRHADDSCPTCVEREQQWNPFKIRFGRAA